MTQTTFLAGINIPVLSVIVAGAISFLLGAGLVTFFNKDTWVRGFFQDEPGPDGIKPPSYSRLTGLSLIFAYINFAIYIVAVTHTIPDFPAALAAFLGGIYLANTARINIGGKQ